VCEPFVYPSSAVERAMKVQEVILRANDGRLKKIVEMSKEPWQTGKE